MRRYCYREIILIIINILIFIITINVTIILFIDSVVIMVKIIIALIAIFCYYLSDDMLHDYINSSICIKLYGRISIEIIRFHLRISVDCYDNSHHDDCCGQNFYCFFRKIKY